MLTKVVLIRHGETNWNLEHRLQGWSDLPLLPRGERQATLLKEHFPLESLDAIY